jgi:putative tryptophan/tyrosine transport system substrate-binding protein
MRRREFMALLAGAAAGWPARLRAQQSTAIGFLHSGSPEKRHDLVSAFHQGLRQFGYVESQNFSIVYRWAEDQYDRLPGLAADLVRRDVSVIAAGALPAALAAQAATATIPIVFATAADPVKAGLVGSLARPSGNLTGLSFLANTLSAKAMGLLHQVAPAAKTIAFVINPINPSAVSDRREAQVTADELNKKLIFIDASAKRGIEEALATLEQQHADAMLVQSDPFLSSRRDELVAFAAAKAIPAIYQFREFAVAGGLMSYGTSLNEAYRQAGVYVGRILRGARPTDLPILQSTKFEFVINFNTAKALGIAIPPGILAIADEVIE